MDNEEKCICEIEGLERGCTLYFSIEWRGGIEFRKINDINYCPVCGKKLLDE